MSDDAPAGIQIPDDLPDDPDEAYLLGVEHTARRIGGGAMSLANAVAEQEEDEEDDECPECGSELTEDFGGRRCTDCDYREG